jgi:lipopolysaccharide transport system ATP-binding protein
VTGGAPAIEVDRLWKRFTRGERHDSLRDFVPSLVRGLRGRAPNANGLRASEFWAVRDVSFAVPRGEAFGIIGPNGAGKSTILKLLTRILRPTGGRCDVHGRVGALIELAAAFHGDLTGRENVFLQGAIMGMRSREVSRVLDEIVAFAGVEEFIDTPVKRYSSGMHARLGFSVAAHLDPDVLIIDEVLSVGDMAFQERCVERMREFKRRGTAIVFVSHNMQAVADLCDRAMYLHTTPRVIGTPQQAIRAYVHGAAAHAPNPSGGAIDIVAARVSDERGPLTGEVAQGSAFSFEVDCVANETARDLHVALFLHRSSDNLVVYVGIADRNDLPLDEIAAGRAFTIRFDLRAHLAGGQYYVAVHVIHNPTHEALARLSPAALLAVQDTRSSKGIADLGMTCRMF